jgi:hypothetical protein
MSSAATTPSADVRTLRPRNTLLDSSIPLPHLPSKGQQLLVQYRFSFAFLQEFVRHGVVHVYHPKTLGNTEPSGLNCAFNCATWNSHLAGTNTSFGADTRDER